MLTLKKIHLFTCGVLSSFGLLLLCWGCSQTKGNADIIDGAKPRLVSSSITDNAANVAVGAQTIVLTFDQNIVLRQPSGIRINDQPAEQASAAFKELMIQATLHRATQYTLTVLANAIEGSTGLFAEEIRLSFTTRGSPEHQIKATLVNANAIPQAKNVYRFLLENYGSKMVSGAMANVNWNINEAEWIFKHTGKYPALACFDYLHLYASPADWINYEDTRVVEDWWNRGGLVAAMWHWNVPAQEGSDQYRFYTKDTQFDVSKAVIDGTYESSLVKADLERIADHLMLLRDKGIPVLWRPLHEAAGAWFWWGAKGAEAYKKLWVLMFETFNKKGLNNLIWVWTSETGDEAWYPGDSYVDIIGVDLYNKLDGAEVAEIYNELQEDYPDKMLALSEFGNVADFSNQVSHGAVWSWAMPWYDYERTNNVTTQSFMEQAHLYANIKYWKNLLEDERTITRDEMPNLK